MNIIKWRDTYNTGVDQFDREHHKIVELINAMFLAIRNKSNLEEVSPLLEEVLDYTSYHFDNEEKVMRDTNYPELETHIEEHRKLKEQSLQFKELLKENFSEQSIKFYRFLRDWLINHILDCDKKYYSHILAIQNKTSPAPDSL